MANTQAFRAMIQKSRPAPGVLAHGIVKKIEFTHDHPGVARVEVHHATEKGAGRGKSEGMGGAADFPTISHVHVHESEAAGVKLGQKVHLRLHDGEYGQMTGDEASE